MTQIYGRSLHIGVNAVDPNHYVDYRGRLQGCENDAWFMAGLAHHHGFTDIRLLLGQQATAAAVLGEIKTAARDLPEGGYFLLSFAGHGGQVLNTDRDEPGEPYDQTWCLYDRQLIDDELRLNCWPLFAKDTRVFVIVDACNSGSSIEVPPGIFASLDGEPIAADRELRVKTRGIPKEIAEGTVLRNHDLYESIRRPLTGKRMTLAGSVTLMAACQDNEQTPDGPQGKFTEAISTIWNGGAFAGTHAEFFEAVSKLAEKSYGKHPRLCCDDTIQQWFLDATAFKI